MKRDIKTVSVLLACAAVAVLVSAAFLSAGGDSDATVSPPTLPGVVQAPPPPINVMGYTKDLGGVAMPGCDVTITNLRTAESAVTSSDSAGYYLYDLNTLTLGWLGGDVIQVEAVKDSLSGVNTGTCSAGMPFLYVDVTLGTVIPEFSMMVVPIAGTLVLFAMVGRRRRKNGDA